MDRCVKTITQCWRGTTFSEGDWIELLSDKHILSQIIDQEPGKILSALNQSIGEKMRVSMSAEEKWNKVRDSVFDILCLIKTMWWEEEYIFVFYSSGVNIKECCLTSSLTISADKTSSPLVYKVKE